MGYLSCSGTRAAGWSFLFSFWSAIFFLLSDASYGGYFLKLGSNYAWAAPVYSFISAKFGYSLSILGFFTLYLSLPLAAAGMVVGFIAFFERGFFPKLVVLLTIVLSGSILWFSFPGVLMTGVGLILLLFSANTDSLWDRLFALTCLSLPPLAAFALCLTALRKSAKPIPISRNDL
jgi:hypothetical protein